MGPKKALRFVHLRASENRNRNRRKIATLGALKIGVVRGDLGSQEASAQIARRMVKDFACFRQALASVAVSVQLLQTVSAFSGGSMPWDFWAMLRNPQPVQLG